VTDGEVIA